MPGFYATDLVTLFTGDATVTVTEATTYSSGGTPVVPDADLFLQGTAAISAQSSTKAANGNSILYNRGTTLQITGGNILSMWTVWPLPSGMSTFDATIGGAMVLAGTSVTALDSFRVNGSDTDPIGGWQNYIIDLRNTPTGPLNTGSATETNQFYGIAYYQTVALTRAALFALDVTRYGRMTFSATQGTSSSVNYATPLTSTSANFPQMSYYDEWNSGTNPTLSATSIGASVDGGFHRLGQLQYTNGVYIAKGIIRLGTVAASVYFDDANRTINFKDEYLTYADFNRLEIRNTGSTVKMTSISFNFIPRNSLIPANRAPATPRCNFEMVDNALLQITSCSFTDMGTFIFRSGAVNSETKLTTFRRCNQVTVAGNKMTECTFEASSDVTGSIIIAQSTDIDNMSFCNFFSNTIGIKISAAGDYTFNGHQFTGNTTQVDYTGVAATKTITAATTVAGVSFTFTSATHGYLAGQKIVIKNVVSSTGSYNNAANEYFTIDSVTTNTFTVLTNQAAGTYTSGGIATIPCLISPTNGSNVLFSSCTASGGGYIVVDSPSVTLTFTGLVTNSEVRVIRVSDRVELGGIENTSGDYIFTHKVGGTLVDIYILHLNYQWYPIYNYTLLSSNAAIPVSQIPDRQYDPGTV